jgi:hypothetical protein
MTKSDGESRRSRIPSPLKEINDGLLNAVIAIIKKKTNVIDVSLDFKIVDRELLENLRSDGYMGVLVISQPDSNV